MRHDVYVCLCFLYFCTYSMPIEWGREKRERENGWIVKRGKYRLSSSPPSSPSLFSSCSVGALSSRPHFGSGAFLRHRSRRGRSRDSVSNVEKTKTFAQMFHVLTLTSLSSWHIQMRRRNWKIYAPSLDTLSLVKREQFPSPLPILSLSSRLHQQGEKDGEGGGE